MTILIFANGIIEEVEWIRPYLPHAHTIIAADGGTRHLFKLNHPPDLMIGDQDSLSPALQRWLAQHSTQLLIHPPAKDETDLELALLYAVQNFSDEILLFGALGGRLDHLLANILLLTHPHLNGRSITLLTPTERAWIVTQKTTITGEIGDTISLIPLKGDVHIKTTNGLQWALHNETLSFGLARGVSNVLHKQTAVIEVQSGTLLCIHTRK